MNVSTKINFAAVPVSKKNFQHKPQAKDTISFGNAQDTEPANPARKKNKFIDKVRRYGLPFALMSSLGIGAFNAKQNATLTHENVELRETLKQTESELSKLKVFVADSKTELGQSVSDLVKQTESKLQKARLDGLKDVVKQCSPAAVGIRVADGGGSGSFIKDTKGNLYILTAAHVASKPIVDGTNSYFNVFLYSGSDKKEPIKVKATVLQDKNGANVIDKKLDLVLLKVDPGTKLPESIGTVELRDLSKEPLSAGETTLVIGNPIGLKDSISTGSVSSSERILDPSTGTIMVQTDAAVNPGNSGGMMVDGQGRLIGVVHAMARPTPLGDGNSLGFAIRVDQVFDFLKAHNIDIK